MGKRRDVPDILQSRKLASLYHVSIDDLIDCCFVQREIEEAIAHIDEGKESKID